MKLMITGAGGFLGKRLASYYEKNYKILALTRSELNFTNSKQVEKIVKTFSPDVIIHCGAISDVSTCAKNPGLSLAVNVEGTHNLAKASAMTGAKFVYCSSDQVYFEAKDDISLAPHSETEKLTPLPVYGQHKLLAEQACFRVQPDSVILRLTWMYDRLTGQEFINGRRNIITTLCSALSNGEAITFSTTDHRGITNVWEVICQMEKAWQLPAGIYNFGSPNNAAMYETTCRILKAFHKSELVVPRAGGGLRNLTMDISKTEQFGIHFSETADGIIHFLSGNFSPIHL